jgi:hypothetical protein
VSAAVDRREGSKQGAPGVGRHQPARLLATVVPTLDVHPFASWVDDGALSNLSSLSLSLSLCVFLSLLLVFVDPTDHASLPFFGVRFVWVEEISKFWSNPSPFLHIGLLVFSPTATSCLVLYLY